MRSGLAYSRRLWLVAHSLGSVGGVWLRLGQMLGLAAELVAEWQRYGQRLANCLPSVERGAAAVAVEVVGGGGLHRRTSQPRRRNNSDPGEYFPPFVFSLPPLSGLYCAFTKQSRNKHNSSTFLKVRQSIYITYTPAEFIIYYTSALLLYYLTRTPPRARASFFLFSFFSYSFSSFIFSFIFSFILLFFSFVFSLFVVSFSFVSFFFFSLPQFLQPFRRRQRVSLSPFLSPSFPCGVFP